MSIDVAISGGRNVIRNNMERKNKCDASNNMGNWNHLKII